jgi:hypothetical protein
MDNKILIVIAILAFYFFFIRKEKFAYPLDDICMDTKNNVDCKTPEGKAKAAAICLNKYKDKIAGIPACQSEDKDIFANACPYNCKVEDLVFASATNTDVTSCDPNNTERKKKDGKVYCKNSQDFWIVAPPGEINPSPAAPPGSQYIRLFNY